jgi:hypothetical protein
MWILPDDVCASILGAWLHLKDISHLDFALCSEVQRNRFLQWISQRGVQFHSVKKVWSNRLYCEWLLRRSIRLCDVGFLNIEPGFASNILAVSVPTLERCSIEGELSSDLMKRVLECGRLRDLRLKGGHLGSDAVALLLNDGRLWNILEIIRSVFVNTDEKIDPARLQVIELIVCFCTIPTALLTAMLTDNTALRVLIMHNCLAVTDACMLTVSQFCPLLEELNVMVTAVTDVGLMAVAHGCPSLSKVAVGSDRDDVEDVTDQAIIAFVLNCTNITVLDVDLCRGLSSLSLQAVIAHLPLLREFYFLYVDCWTDAALMHLVEAHPNLTHLRLSEASALTDAGLAAALHNLKCLSLVSISVEEGFFVRRSHSGRWGGRHH